MATKISFGAAGLAFALLCGGCVTLPASFTTDNVLSLHPGLGAEEIQKLFGTPKNVKQAVCGAATGHAWTCTTWEYGEFPYDRATFTFNSDGGSSFLNDFEVHRTGGSLPASFTSENVLKIRQGMGSGEILREFGAPRSVRQAVCGASTGRPWTCTTWEYGEFPYARASFTFSAEGGLLILNNFEVQKK